MKTPQRNFTVEFKSGRRRPSAQPASIWGNTDLKALVRKAEKDAPHLFGPSVNGKADGGSGGRQAAVAIPRILENTIHADAQPVAKAQAGGSPPEQAGAEIAPSADPVLRPKVAAKRRLRLKVDDLAAARSADLRGTIEQKHVRGSGLTEHLDDLAVLEEENQRLRSLLCHRLRQQNRQLRQMLVRFNAV